ncbi:MAG: TonB-dependent receptor, partial [Pseudomonadota bacterium]
GGFLAQYEVAENVEAYLDAFFFRNVTDAQIAPSATFGEIQTLNCNNPFLTADLVDVICTQRGFGPMDDASVQVNRRFVEGGGRNSKIEIDNMRFVTGLRGSIFDSGWNWDAFISYNTTSQTDTNTNDAQIDLLQDALLVVNDANGNPVCRSGNAGCLPLNLLGTGPVDTTALASVLTPTLLNGEGTQLIIGGTVEGIVEGFKSPMADDGMAMLVGVEYREDTLNSQPDAVLSAGNATGLGGPALPTDGAVKVTEIFGEIALPLITGAEFAEELGITAQYRYSDYDYTNNLPGGAQANGVSTDAYSFGVSWTPVSDLRLRGQFQRAVRAPNIFELFDPAGLQLFSASDPCSGAIGSANLTASQAECARTGLPNNLYGLVQEDAGQLQQLAGGNVNLQPETSDTFTVGAVIQPSALPGMILSVDYFDISVDEFITNIPSTAILSNCLDGSQPALCSFINRDSLGTLQVNGFITANLQNIASRQVEGFDFNLSYGTSFADLGLPDYGNLNFRYVSTLYTALEQQSFEGAPITDCLGQWGGDCNTFTGEVNPEYKHTMTLGYSPADAWNIDLTWRYIGKVESFDDQVPTTGIGNVFGSENFFDLFGTWEVRDGVQLRAGVNNIFDNDPPISDFRFTANGNTFPSTYDSAGRFVFMGVNLKL